MTPGYASRAPVREEPRILHNPFAPPALAGIEDASPPGYKDVQHWYTTPLLTIPGLGIVNQTLQVGMDADFVWLALASTDVDLISVRFEGEDGRYINNFGILTVFGARGRNAFPFPIFPYVVYPAGSLIRFQIQNYTAAPAPVQYRFLGVKRYKL
jgi:hypothetical protein